MNVPGARPCPCRTPSSSTIHQCRTAPTWPTRSPDSPAHSWGSRLTGGQHFRMIARASPPRPRRESADRFFGPFLPGGAPRLRWRSWSCLRERRTSAGSGSSATVGRTSFAADRRLNPLARRDRPGRAAGFSRWNATLPIIRFFVGAASLGPMGTRSACSGPISRTSRGSDHRPTRSSCCDRGFYRPVRLQPARSAGKSSLSAEVDRSPPRPLPPFVSADPRRTAGRPDLEVSCDP
jgi:hypothetical protein